MGKERKYTALKGGIVYARGTFTNKDLLDIDYPASEYDLLVDELLDPPVEVETYVEKRALAYPPLSEFADAMYWQSKGDNSKMLAYLAKCDEVKASIPKEG